MGKINNGLDKLLLSKPKMIDYTKLTIVERDFIAELYKEYIKPNPILRTRRRFLKKKLKPKQDNFWNYSWSDIVLLRKYISEDNLFEVMRMVYGVSEFEFIKLELLNVFSSLKWITEQLKAISAAEEERLGSELLLEDINAGAEELQEYGYYSALRALQPDLLKHEEMMKLPYALIFRELAISELIRNINHKKQENATRTSKRNR